MKRDDFMRHGWVMERPVEGTVLAVATSSPYTLYLVRLERIKGKLSRGRETLHYLRNTRHLTYDVPNPKVNELMHRREGPRNTDP